MPNGITAAPPPLKRDKMCLFEPTLAGQDPPIDYPTAALLPIFASGIARFAGYEVAPVIQCREGLRAVFRYWFDNKLPCCGNEPDLGDVAFQIAMFIGDQIYGDELVEAAPEVVR